MPESIKAALVSYAKTPHPATGTPPDLSPADCAHLERWEDDDRADEDWQTIDRASRQAGKLPPVRVFIQEILGARSFAESFHHRQERRGFYRKRATQMEAIAAFLREPLPGGMLLIPSGAKLARMLDDAARQYREDVEVSRIVPGQVKWTRESKPRDIFMSLVSNYLNNITRRWLDDEVAILAQIAFDDPDIDREQVEWLRRQVKRRRRP
jgi:hypothetical protein